MNNSTDDCTWYTSVGETIDFWYAYVMMPITFTLGLFTQTLTLKAFYEQAKKESGYWYQLFIGITTLLLILTRGFYCVIALWLPKVTWFKSSYVGMWMYGHLSSPLAAMFVTTSLLLAVAVSADRIFALGKPFVYKSINHKRHQALACAIYVMLGISSSIFNLFRWYPSPGSNGVFNLKRTDARFLDVLSTVRDVIRASGTIALNLCNVLMLVLYNRYVRKVENVASSSEVKERRAQQRVLAFMAASEAIFITASMIALIVVYNSAQGCGSHFMSTCQDITTDLSSVADSAVAFAASKSFRKTIYNSVPCLRKAVLSFVSVFSKYGTPTT